MHPYVGVRFCVVYVDKILGFGYTDIESAFICSVPDSKFNLSTDSLTEVVWLTVQAAQVIQILFTFALSDECEARRCIINIRGCLEVSRLQAS